MCTTFLFTPTEQRIVFSPQTNLSPTRLCFKIHNVTSHAFDEVKYFNKKSIANNEVKNVVIRPITSGKKLNELNSFKEEMNSTKAAREMAGIPRRKENLAASLRSQPETRAVEIVTPDLDTPGKMAKA